MILMIILIKLFLNSKLLVRIQIQKGGKVLLWNQVKSRMEVCYSEVVLEKSRQNAPCCFVIEKIYAENAFILSL